MTENGMLTGASRYHDSRASSADQQAQLAQTMSQMLTDAVLRGNNPPLLRSGVNATLASDALFELYGVEQEILYRACTFAQLGEPTLAADELRKFIEVAAQRFGTNAAESLLEED